MGSGYHPKKDRAIWKKVLYRIWRDTLARMSEEIGKKEVPRWKSLRQFSLNSVAIASLR